MRDLRAYARQTQVRLILGGLGILIVVGSGLIDWIYGREAALLGLMCILAGLLPILIIVLYLSIMDWIVHHAQRK